MEGLASYWVHFKDPEVNPVSLISAAQSAIDPPEQSQTGSASLSRFNAKVDTASTSFLKRLEALNHIQGLSWWEGWAAEHQREEHLEGLAPGLTAVLMTAYREECAKKSRAVMAELRVTLAETPLSEWDMRIHTVYGYCTYETGQFGESVLLTGLNLLLRRWLFLEWVQNSILPLPQADQDAIHKSVVANATEILEDDAASPIEQVMYVNQDIQSEISAIPFPKELILP